MFYVARDWTADNSLGMRMEKEYMNANYTDKAPLFPLNFSC